MNRRRRRREEAGAEGDPPLSERLDALAEAMLERARQGAEQVAAQRRRLERLSDGGRQPHAP